MENILKKSVLKTLVYFDLFYYPLTAYETWQYLPEKTDFLTCKKTLDSLVKENKISEKESFYFLKNKENLINYRNKRYHFANRKIKIARRTIKLFSYIPWLKFVALSNLIGRHNMRDGSDIDLFIITSKNRLWLSRFFCAGLMKLLNKRPNKKTKRDKICLSFYIDEANLNIEDLSLKNKDDYYFYYWLVGLYPLYDKNAYHYFLINNNQWLKKYLPNIDLFLINQVYAPKVKDKKSGNKIFNFLEKIMANLQIKIMPKNLKEKANIDSKVVIKEGILKLYLIDRREEFQARYLKHLNKYIKEND
jgi:hypothetical protein